ncbi:hypothetical protein ABPG72_012445 [Tetrahymena utriculariae]
MGKRQSKQITYNLITVISDQCLLKTCSCLQYGHKTKSCTKGVPGFSKLYFLISFERCKSQDFSSLEVAENSIFICQFPLMKQRRFFNITKKTKLYVEEQVYDKHIECLRSRCFHETQNLLMNGTRQDQKSYKNWDQKYLNAQIYNNQYFNSNNSISILDIKYFSENLSKCTMLKQITLLLGANIIGIQGTHVLSHYLAKLPKNTLDTLINIKIYFRD